MTYFPMKYGEIEKNLWSFPLIQVFQSFRPAVLLEAKMPNEIHPLPRVILYWRMQLPQQLDLVQAYYWYYDNDMSIIMSDNG